MKSREGQSEYGTIEKMVCTLLVPDSP